jgi:hypothetical protein
MVEQVGSPLSGGYASTKRTVRFLADYALHRAEKPDCPAEALAST